MPNLARVILLTAVLLAAFPAGRAASHEEPREETPGSPLALHVEGGLLSADVRDVPLGDVLHDIAEQAAVKLEIHSGGADRVTDSFTGVRLGEGIRRLARGHDVILIYGAAQNGAERGRLVEAHVYEASAPVVSSTVDPSARPARLRAVVELTRQAQQQQPGALASLTGLLSGDADPVVRARAAAALGTIGGPEAAAALTAALGDQDASVRVSAVSSLGRMREEGAVGSVVQILAGDRDASVRRAAIWALSSLQSEDAHRAIEAAAADPDWSVRRAAAGALRSWQLRHARTN
jgi:HEAT repeat protein